MASPYIVTTPSQQVIQQRHNNITLFIPDTVYSVLQPGFRSRIFSEALFNATTWL